MPLASTESGLCKIITFLFLFMSGYMIAPATGSRDLAVIAQIARATWPVAYRDMIPASQIDYMLDLFYTPASLERQAEELGHRFFILQNEDQAIGFASIEYDFEETGTCKLHKLYILPSGQKSGAGKFLMQYIIHTAMAQHQQSLILQVNRKNAALGFYRHLGFSIRESLDLDIGKGYFMNDYVMELSLNGSGAG